MRTDWDVIVVGAGLAGLAAGATAAAGGAETVVLEAHRPGGRARTVEKGPYVFGMGPHALYLGGAGTRILRSLGIEPDGVPSPFPRYKLLKDGEVHRVPSGPANLMRTGALSAAGKTQFGRLLGLLPMMRADRLAGVSVREWLDGHGLRPEVDAVARTLIRLATYTADVDGFSAGAAVRQLQIGARPGVLYLHGGWAQLVDGLAAQARVESGAKVSRLEPSSGGIEVFTAAGRLTARQVIVAAGTPTAARAVLPDDPGWPALGPPVTGACLDLGVTRVPEPGYVLGVDEPLAGFTSGPPARLAPDGHAVVQAGRYGATDADADRLALEGPVARLGVRAADIAQERFLARMVVAGSTPLASAGGLGGRPSVTATGHRNLLLAGDWVGPEGLLADASLASGHEAARRALDNLERAPVLVA